MVAREKLVVFLEAGFVSSLLLLKPQTQHHTKKEGSLCVCVCMFYVSKFKCCVIFLSSSSFQCTFIKVCIIFNKNVTAVWDTEC